VAPSLPLCHADLADIMLRDSRHIQEADAQFINKWHLEQGKPPSISAALYTGDAEQVAHFFIPWTTLNRSNRSLAEGGIHRGRSHPWIRCNPARSTGKAARCICSPGYRAIRLPILRDPILPFNSDYLMMECTYGDRHMMTPESHQEFPRLYFVLWHAV